MEEAVGHALKGGVDGNEYFSFSGGNLSEGKDYSLSQTMSSKDAAYCFNQICAKSLVFEARVFEMSQKLF